MSAIFHSEFILDLKREIVVYIQLVSDNAFQICVDRRLITRSTFSLFCPSCVLFVKSAEQV